MNKNTSNNTANDAAAKPDDDKLRRRMQDRVAPKDPMHKLNLDRRVKYSDRRKNSDPNYKGPSRRYTIDRRVSAKDRRRSD